MLFKWLVLAFVAWYVYRAGRNLLRAATGRPEEPLTAPRRNAPPRPEQPRPHQAKPARDVSDVEDARFVDL